MRKFLIFGCFLVGLTGNAQIKNVAIHISANYPLIKSLDNTDERTRIPINPASGYTQIQINAGGVKESFAACIGFTAGAHADYDVSPRFFLTSGLSLSYLQFQRSVDVTGIASDTYPIFDPNLPFHQRVGAPFGTIYRMGTYDSDGNIVLYPSPLPSRSENLGKTKTFSLQLPLLIGITFLKEKLRVRTGVVFAYLLKSTEVKERYTATRSITEYDDTSKEGFNEFMTGAAVHTTYLIGRKIGVDLTGQKFFIPIYENSRQEGGKAKYNILSLGLSYYL